MQAGRQPATMGAANQRQAKASYGQLGQLTEGTLVSRSFTLSCTTERNSCATSAARERACGDGGGGRVARGVDWGRSAGARNLRCQNDTCCVSMGAPSWQDLALCSPRTSTVSAVPSSLSAKTLHPQQTTLLQPPPPTQHLLGVGGIVLLVC